MAAAITRSGWMSVNRFANMAPAEKPKMRIFLSAAAFMKLWAASIIPIN